MASNRQVTPAIAAARFKKGKSGNPHGRKPDTEEEKAAKRDAKEAAKAHTLTAINTLVDIMLNGKNDASRVNAAVAILNRGHGAPTQTLDVDVNHKQDWSALLTALDAHNAVKQLAAEESAPLVIQGEVLTAEKGS